MEKEVGLIELVRIVKDKITHQDYKRVCDLAGEYYKLVTGDGLSDLLRQVIKRESDEEFEMRKLLTNSVIPPTLSATKLPFQKVVRKKPISRVIDWKSSEDNENKKTELEEAISTYWGDASLEEYFEYAFVDYNYLDPNAFLITEFDPFDPAKEKAKPYPFVATSEQAIMFEINNNILEYLVVKLPIRFMRDKVETDGSSYTMYLGADTIRLRQTGSKEEDGFDVMEINNDYFAVEYYAPLANKVPARRFGYKRDPETSGRTFISAFHDIIHFLNKTLKIDSELDISTAMVAFPQRIAYVPPCSNCNKGKLPDGNTCPVCNGTGKEPFHNSVMDIITLDMPRDPQDVIQLENLLIYKSPPIELLTFQKEYINEMRANVFLMMFNKELYSKAEIAATATEKVLEIDNMNDTLRPFAKALSTMWRYVVEDIATFTDKGEGLILEHKYPDDFKFKSLTELMAELQAAKNADASTSTIAAIEDDINELLYADRPEELKIIRIKNSVNPFRGYSEENVRLLISSGMTTKFNVTLWSNLESIFNELEHDNTDPWLYDLAYPMILEKVAEKVVQYMEVIDAEAMAGMEPLGFGEEEPPAGGQEEEKPEE